MCVVVSEGSSWTVFGHGQYFALVAWRSFGFVQLFLIPTKNKMHFIVE
jgi:hypothetical protein